MRFQCIDISEEPRFGFPRALSLSRVLACLFIEFLESGLRRFIITNVSKYFRYISDLIRIYPRKMINVTDKLNKIEPIIGFTYELETMNILLFIDNFLINNKNNLLVIVHHKSFNKITTNIFTEISIIHRRSIRDVFSDALSSLPISGYFCIISAPTVTPDWLW